MIRLTSLCLALCACASFAQLQLDENDEQERQQYGLSQAEWQMYKQSGMSIDELKRLLECGIGMNEYNSRPWISVGVSEKEWLSEKCKGMSNEAIQAFHEGGDAEYGVFLAFFLPGSYHWMKKSYGKAAALSGIFALSVTLYFTMTVEEETPPQAVAGSSNSAGESTIETLHRPIFLVIAAADMIGSAILAYRDMNRIKIQDSEEPASTSSLHLDLRDGRPGLQWVRRF